MNRVIVHQFIHPEWDRKEAAVNTTKQVEKSAASDPRGSKVFLRRTCARGTAKIHSHSYSPVEDVLMFQVFMISFIGKPSSIPQEWEKGKVLSRLYAIRGVAGKTRLRITLEDEVIEVHLKGYNSEGKGPQGQMSKIVKFPPRHR